APIVHEHDHECKSEASQHVWEIDWITTNPIKLERIQLRQDIRADASDCNRFVWTDDQICKGHRPSGEKADDLGEDLAGIGDLASGIRDAFRQTPVDISNWNKYQSADQK